VDHVIPKASGVIVDEEWNLRAMHARCNASKGSQITTEAIELAASHGLILPAATATAVSAA
jgi:5-methylcytosine-specific restriction endonuclease McrA